MTDIRARIPLVDPDQLTEEEAAVFGALGPVRAGRDQPPSGGAGTRTNHAIRTFARHPALATRFLPFNGYLLSDDAVLPVRLRQLAIHRVAWLRRCVYMWSSHLRVSLPLGLTRDDFDAVKIGASSPHWSPSERTLMRAVDSLVELSDVTDEVWEQLSEELDDRQLMDLLFTVGCYLTVGLMFNAVRVEREAELQALGAEYGVPDRPLTTLQSSQRTEENA